MSNHARIYSDPIIQDL